MISPWKLSLKNQFVNQTSTKVIVVLELQKKNLLLKNNKPLTKHNSQTKTTTLIKKIIILVLKEQTEQIQPSVKKDRLDVNVAEEIVVETVQVEVETTETQVAHLLNKQEITVTTVMVKPTTTLDKAAKTSCSSPLLRKTMTHGVKKTIVLNHIIKDQNDLNVVTVLKEKKKMSVKLPIIAEVVKTEV